MNLLDLAPALERVAPPESEPLRANSERCTRRWNRANACRRCVDGCPTGALTLTAEGVALAESACVKCGYCLRACPTGAFEGPDETALLLKCVAALPKRATLDLACSVYPAPMAAQDADALVQIGGCLAALGPAAYTGLTALGVERMRLRLEGCAACPLGALRAQIESACVEASALTRLAPTTVDAPPAVQARRAVISTRQPLMSRRHILRRMVGARAGDGLLPAAPEDEKAPPSERRLLIHFLAQLPAAERGTGAFFPALEAHPSCTACRVCATVCPTGALTLASEANHFALRFDPQACTDCGLCVELCPPRALRPAGLLPAADATPVRLVEGALKACMRCRTHFAGPGDLCPTCAYRRSNPFGSRLRPTPLLPP